jgi:DNA-binding transcriptional ArsR family regulator
MGRKGEGDDFEEDLVRALGHPLRVTVLRILEDGPSSPKKISDRIDEPLGNVSYHMKVLLDCHCIELAKTVPRRGAMEHIYKLRPRAAFGSRDWQEVPSSLRSHLAGKTLDAFMRRAVEALRAGTPERRKGSGVTWLPLTVDEAGWNELVQAVEGLEKAFFAVAERSAGRLTSPAEGIRVIVAAAAFEASRDTGGS